MSIRSLKRAVASSIIVTACGDPLDLGSDVVWSTDHESGLQAWSEDSRGGVQILAEAGSVELSEGNGHGEGHAAALSSDASAFDTGAVLRRESAHPEAFYSAWFFVPQQIWTRASWTIFNLQTRAGGMPSPATDGLSLNLRSLPDGGYVLYVFHHNVRYLQAPLADPVPLVEVGRWFQLSAFFRAATDDTGQLTVWLDGQQVYDIRNRPTGNGAQLYWSVGSVALGALDAPAEIYVDDAAISLQRVPPDAPLDYATGR